MIIGTLSLIFGEALQSGTLRLSLCNEKRLKILIDLMFFWADYYYYQMLIFLYYSYVPRTDYIYLQDNGLDFSILPIMLMFLSIGGVYILAAAVYAAVIGIHTFQQHN